MPRHVTDSVGRMAALDRAAHRALADIVGGQHVLTEPDAIAPFEIDWTRRYRGSTPAVLRPGSTAEVAAIVDWARREGVALVPQGGNTGLVGGAAPMGGEVVVSLCRLDVIGDVDVTARQVTAGAGATIA